MISPPLNAAGQPMHERILLYGDADAGKTRCLLSVAKWHQRKRSDAVFYVVSTDRAYERMLSGEFASLTNVHYEDADDMEQVIAAGHRMNKKVRSQDWLSIDVLGDCWGMAQDEYSMKRFRKPLGDYWVTTGDSDHPIEGWDWGPINARYRVLANNIVMRCRGHVMCMAGEAALKEESKSGKGGEEKVIKDLFEKIARKPQGQKDDPKRFHTILYLGKKGKGWGMTTAKDRERERLQGAPLQDFFVDYLRAVGGWKL